MFTSLNLKKVAVVSALSMVALLGTTSVANAQRDRDNEWRKQDDQRNERQISKQQEKMNRERAKAEAKRIREEQKRQAAWARQNRRNGRNDVYVTTVAQNDRYWVYRNGSYYQTDNRGANMLRQAVNEGYRQGFQAGQYDRNNRRRSIWTSNNVYQSGSYGYESGVDRGQYQYYFQQGFQRGYQDGYNSRNQYGSGGSLLGNILSSILDIRIY